MEDLYSTIYQSLDPAHKLLTVVSCNLLEQLAILIRDGAGVNDKLQNQNGNRALHIAAQKGHHECMQQLIHAGANPDQSNDFGMTAMALALRHGHPMCVKMLLCTGSLMSDPMMTWLSQQLNTGNAIWCAYSAEMIKLLLIATPDILSIGPTRITQLYDTHIKSLQSPELIKAYCLSGISFNPQQLVHVTTNGDDELAMWVKNIQTVQPLQHYARLAIRRRLHPNVIYGTKLLPLPTKVQEYLLFEDCL